MSDLAALRTALDKLVDMPSLARAGLSFRLSGLSGAVTVARLLPNHLAQSPAAPLRRRAQTFVGMVLHGLSRQIGPVANQTEVLPA